MCNIKHIGSLYKEVSVLDFKDKIYYDIYSEIVGFLVNGINATYKDLKFKFSYDAIALDVVEKMEQQLFDVGDINSVYREMVQDAQRDRLKDLGKEIINRYNNGDNYTDILAIAETELIKINSNSDSSLVSLSNEQFGYLNDLNERIRRFNKRGSIEDVVDLPTGIKSLDDIILGLPRRASTLIAASTSDGKTQLAIQVADNISRVGKKVLYFMLEDVKENIINRIISLRSQVSLQKIRSGSLSEKEYNKITTVFDNLARENNWFIEDTLFDVNDIVAKIKFASIKYPDLSVIILDNINLAMDRLCGGNREQEISLVSKKIISVAKNCNLAAVILQQLNTNPDDRRDGMPVRMVDTRDSKAPGHDASVALFIHYPDKHSSEANYSKERAQLVVGKNRYGEVNKFIQLTNQPNIARFSENIPALIRDMQNGKDEEQNAS
jgi:replicative DNA helicase